LDWLTLLFGMGIGVLVGVGFAIFLHELWHREKEEEIRKYGRSLR
jgi:hypothetical protein